MFVFLHLFLYLVYFLEYWYWKPAFHLDILYSVIVIFKKYYVKRCLFLLDSGIRQWAHCGHKAIHMVRNNTQGTMFSSYQGARTKTRKYPPHPYTTTNNSLNCLFKAGWIHAFILFMANFYPTIWMLKQKSRFIKSGKACQIICCPFLVSTCKLEPLKSKISPREMPLTGCFSVKPWDSCVGTAE